MFRNAFLALCCCACLISCQQQMQSVAYALQSAHSVAEDTPVFLSVGQAEYRLQLLPNKGGVRVTSSFHPLCPLSLKNRISTGTFVLKDDAYGVESKLRAIMAQGYKQRDVEQGAKDIAGEMPYIAYDINGTRIFRSLRSFSAGDDWASYMSTPLYVLNYACTAANTHELPAPKRR